MSTDQFRYDGMGPERYIPVLPEKEGYVIDFDDESGWPYYITVEAFEQRKKMHDAFMSRITNMIQGEPRKGKIEIISTLADVNTGDDFKNIWNEINTKP